MFWPTNSKLQQAKMKKRKNRYWFKNCIATKIQPQDDRVLTMLICLPAFNFGLVIASGKTKIIKD